MIASAFADLGFDVDIGPLFQTPAETARRRSRTTSTWSACRSLAAGHLTLVPELTSALKKPGRDDIMSSSAA